jgi:HAD superfamily hydrolase (TIGR01509 family)
VITATDRLVDGVDLLVLDVQGVLFNKPLEAFLYDVGERTGEGGQSLQHRWQRELRTPFWTGHLDEASMWKQLARSESPSALRRELESRYERGPLWTRANTFPGEVWLLSNHRSRWLHERIARFGITDRFNRIVVSDDIGAVKPDPRAFCAVSEQCLTRSVLFVDDQIHNVEAARGLGIRAALATADGTLQGR